MCHFWSLNVSRAAFFVFAPEMSFILFHRRSKGRFRASVFACAPACFAAFFCVNVCRSCVSAHDRGVSQHDASPTCGRSVRLVLVCALSCKALKIGFTINTGSSSIRDVDTPPFAYRDQVLGAGQVSFLG